jgi:hypothetical protein
MRSLKQWRAGLANNYKTPSPKAATTVSAGRGPALNNKTPIHGALLFYKDIFYLPVTRLPVQAF